MSVNPTQGPYKANGHRIVTEDGEFLIAKSVVASGVGFNRDEIGEFRSEEMATARLLAASWDLRDALLGLIESPRSKRKIAIAMTALKKAGKK